MKLKEAINHNTPEKIKKSLDNFKYWDIPKSLVKISRECSDFIKQMRASKQALVRGSHNSDVAGFRSKAKKERSTVDTPKNIDNYIDEFRRKNYSNYASRKRAVFCIPAKFDFRSADIAGLDKDVIYQYGPNMFLVFPKNGSKYFQSVGTIDLFTSSVMGIGRSYFDALKDLDPYVDTSLLDRSVMKMNYSDLSGEGSTADKVKNIFDNELTKYFERGVDRLTKMEREYETVIEHNGYYYIRAHALKYYALWYPADEDILGPQHAKYLKTEIL